MSEKKDKSLITWIIGAVSIVALIVIVVVALIMSNNKLNDAFFVSDETKSVLEFSAGDGMFDIDVDMGKYVPEKAYLVYFYSGDKVTGLNVYYEYEDFATAKKARNYFNEQRKEDSTEVEKIIVNSNYVVITMVKDFYDGMTAESAKEQIEFMEILKSFETLD